MTRTISTVVLLATLLLASITHAAPHSYAMPAAINPSARYLLFFHNYYVETKGPDGECKYYDILKAFTERGFSVISELRPKDASVVDYAKKAAADVQKLLDAGVPPENITVAGHSKGAVIAIRAASLVGMANVRYVIMAGCGIKGLEKAYPDFSQLRGNILSIYATSDKVAGSCTPAFAQAKQGVIAREIALESNAGHQLFFTPTDVWLEPVAGWPGK